MCYSTPLTILIVPGIDPGIHAPEIASNPGGKHVDGRVKPGHDGLLKYKFRKIIF
jgi:hypothetical protein